MKKNNFDTNIKALEKVFYSLFNTKDMKGEAVKISEYDMKYTVLACESIKAAIEQLNKIHVFN